ncbi:MAG: hypothetical protein K2M43_00640 [Mycoplasmoidaceae bacterium]|nr:hypothetical protein [Mycoplasmoidaceae bacterium]
MFSPSIKYLIQELDKKYQAEHLYPSTESLLDYGIPYFAQTFSFAYKGEAIQQLENATS